MMKAILLSALAAYTVTATPLLLKRQGALPQAVRPGDLATGVLCTPPGGRVADPAGAAPRRVELKSTQKSPGVKRVKLRHGPYKVPNMMTKSVMGEGGALWNCGDDRIEKPCEECFITRMQAGLEYPDGTNANIDTGMWLHHMVSFTVGKGRWDPTCVNQATSLPHFAIASTPKHSERNFASGNERTPADLTMWAGKAGYQILASDSFRVIVDLMNMNMEDKVVYLTMTYDYTDGKLPADYLDVKPIWFDVDQCGMSEVHPPKDDGNFTVTAKAWHPNFEGEMVGLGGHLHDGGVNAQILVNGTSICDSTAKYGESPEFVFKGANSMSTGEKFAENHISSMNICYLNGPQAKKLDKSQAWTLEALYDYNKFTGNREADGGQADVMGIAIAYATVKQGGVPLPL